MVKSELTSLLVLLLSLRVEEFSLSASGTLQSFSLSGQLANRLLLMSTGVLKWKEDLQQKASQAFLRQQEAAPNLKKLVYGSGRQVTCFISGSRKSSH